MGMVIICLVYIVGGEIILKQMHEELFATKRLLSTLSMEIIRENPYIKNYLNNNMNV
jgi:hypothetical protein